MTDRPQRIFIVEDEVMVAFEMTDTLEDLGFEVVGPSVHLEDAKDRAANDDIDIAFLDVNLGASNTSRPVAELLRERGIPFVFITAYDPEQVEFVQPDERVVRKPISTQKILSALKGLFPDAPYG